MTQTTWEVLRSRLVDRYSEFRRQLSRHLGSAELASDALQETWLRLQRPGTPTIVGQADAYIYRVALNVARESVRSAKRRLVYSEVEMLRHLDVTDINPEEIVAFRSEMSLLAKAINELTPRQRAVFLAARIDKIPHKEIAQRYGISKRMVERELRTALDHCVSCLGRISESGSAHHAQNHRIR
ncbi:sigma-70 family RNA polymerase sigma factor [Microbacteriaceae bacterium K1510]|nr:sigma-70 family RNA polymerase sigma factor [Microbacteriaceae bacterium K1510]